MANMQNGQLIDLPSEILQALSKNEPILSSEAFPSLKSTEVKSALDRLGSRSMVTYETIDRELPVLEAEAEEIAANGSHEARVFEALRNTMDGLTISELEAAVGDKTVVKVGQGKAFRSKWISKGKEGRLVASVSWEFDVLGKIELISTDGLDTRHNARTTAGYTKDTDTSRSESN
jgi:phenylalanyl-tRNA synthetase alpha chain